MPRLTAEMLGGFLGKVAHKVSLEASIKLAHSYGGERLYVPAGVETINAEHTLARAIGLGAARRLVELFGGYQYDIPSARGLFRWREARALRAVGKTPREIAAALRIGLAQAKKLAASDVPPRSENDGDRRRRSARG